MRKYHRWLSVIFGVFLLWIAATGLAGHFAAIVADGSPPVAAPAGFVCPEGMICRVKPAPDSPQAWVSFFHHIHAGEEFGPVGTAISILSGFALLFFAFSGLWMYIRMWSHRRDKEHKPAWFWK